MNRRSAAETCEKVPTLIFQSSAAAAVAVAVADTGAGISTESGIPDFRSPGGVWSRMKPIYFQEFVGSEAKRREAAGAAEDLLGRLSELATLAVQARAAATPHLLYTEHRPRSGSSSCASARPPPPA